MHVADSGPGGGALSDDDGFSDQRDAFDDSFFFFYFFCGFFFGCREFLPSVTARNGVHTLRCSSSLRACDATS